jgi:hypothetical protein
MAQNQSGRRIQISETNLHVAFTLSIFLLFGGVAVVASLFLILPANASQFLAESKCNWFLIVAP